MKTIYLKAEVVRKKRDGMTVLQINGKEYAIDDKDLEQAQVLAVEQVLEWLKKSRYGSIEIYEDESFCLGVIDGKSEPHENISELTELVRGEERTLEDVISELKLITRPEQVGFLNLIEEAEQLLKNRE